MMKRLWWMAIVVCVLIAGRVVDRGALSAQAPKPAPAKASPKPRPATPAAPQARAIQRVDTVNPEAIKEFETNDRVAIVAAVGRYGDDLAPLQFTVADAVELAAELKRQGYVVFTLLNNEATNDNIKLRLESVAQTKPATLVFAFAGHGFQAKSGTNFLATYGTTVDALEQRGLGLPDVEGLMKATGAKRSVVLIDACRNVPGSRAVSASTSFRDFSQSEGVRILLSTRPGGFSYEDPALQHGIFTHFVIEGLRGKAANADGKVTFDDLANYVEKNVLTYAAGRNFVQKPFRSGEASGDFLLATGTPLKDAEIARAREESGSKDLSNDAVLVKRQGALDSFMMVSQEKQLRLYQVPSMQPFATLTLNEAVKGLPEGYRRYDGPAGKGDQLMHAAVRFQDGLPFELVGRLGTACSANCGAPIRLPGDGAQASTIADRGSNAARAAGRIVGGVTGRRTVENKVDRVASGVDKGVEALQSMKWAAFNLAPELKGTR